MCTCVYLQLVAYYRQGNRLPPSPLCPPEVSDIIKKCWEYQAADRPSFSDLSTEIICAMLNIGIWYFCTTLCLYIILLTQLFCSFCTRIKHYQCLIPVLRVEPIPNLHAYWWKRRRPDDEACRKTSSVFPREALGGGGAISVWLDVPPGL